MYISLASMSLEDQEFDDNHDQPEELDESGEDSLQEFKEDAEDPRAQIPEWRRGKFSREQKLLRKFFFLFSPEEKEACSLSEARLVHILEQLAREALETPLSKL